MLNGIDKDGNLYLTHDVSVTYRGNTVLSLGSGSDAVIKFYRIAEAGIPGATETNFSFNLNVQVSLYGESLLNLVEKHYPETWEEAKGRIDLQKKYVIDCYDMS